MHSENDHVARLRSLFPMRSEALEYAMRIPYPLPELVRDYLKHHLQEPAFALFSDLHRAVASASMQLFADTLRDVTDTLDEHAKPELDTYGVELAASALTCLSKNRVCMLLCLYTFRSPYHHKKDISYIFRTVTQGHEPDFTACIRSLAPLCTPSRPTALPASVASFRAPSPSRDSLPKPNIPLVAKALDALIQTHPKTQELAQRLVHVTIHARSTRKRPPSWLGTNPTLVHILALLHKHPHLFTPKLQQTLSSWALDPNLTHTHAPISDAFLTCFDHLNDTTQTFALAPPYGPFRTQNLAPRYHFITERWTTLPTPLQSKAQQTFLESLAFMHHDFAHAFIQNLHPLVHDPNRPPLPPLIDDLRSILTLLVHHSDELVRGATADLWMETPHSTSHIADMRDLYTHLTQDPSAFVRQALQEGYTNALYDTW